MVAIIRIKINHKEEKNIDITRFGLTLFVSLLKFILWITSVLFTILYLIPSYLHLPERVKMELSQWKTAVAQP